jgi:hypothetical protein
MNLVTALILTTIFIKVLKSKNNENGKIHFLNLIMKRTVVMV